MPSAPEQRALQISVEESPHFGLWSSPELFALQRALSIQKNTPAFKPPLFAGVVVCPAFSQRLERMAGGAENTQGLRCPGISQSVGTGASVLGNGVNSGRRIFPL